MTNISEKTTINGYDGKRGTLQQALSDKNLHRNLQYSYFGKFVQRGTVEVLLHGSWKTVTFSSRNGWAQEITVG